MLIKVRINYFNPKIKKQGGTPCCLIMDMSYIRDYCPCGKHLLPVMFINLKSKYHQNLSLG